MVGPVDRLKNNFQKFFLKIIQTPITSESCCWFSMFQTDIRAVWWVEQITNNPGVYTMEDFYQKYPNPLA